MMVRCCVLVLLAGAAGGALATGPVAPSVSALIRVTSTTPYVPPPAGSTSTPDVTACMGPAEVNDVGTIYRNSESEPFIAVNPTDANNMIIAHHVDRISIGGGAVGIGVEYTRDGGKTWRPVLVPLTRCSGAPLASGTPGDFERSTDPWIDFGPDGIAYLVGAPFNVAQDFREAFTVARSLDGGQTWQGPFLISLDPTFGTINVYDEPKIVVDPAAPNTVYFSGVNYPYKGPGKDRLGAGGKHNQMLFSRSIDGGVTWTPIRVVGEFPASTINERFTIVVLPPSSQHPQGILLSVFGVAPSSLNQTPSPSDKSYMAVVRSFDRGETWTAPVTLDQVVTSTLPLGEPYDAELGISFSIGETDLAVDPRNGDVYAAWEDARFSGTSSDGVVVARSRDGGATWSVPVSGDPATPPGVQASFEKLAVAADGTVGILFYDFRNDRPGDATLDTDAYLTLLTPTADGSLAFTSEVRLTPASFDTRQLITRSTILSGFAGYFPGDYAGLRAAGNESVAAFTVANPNGTAPQSPIVSSSIAVDSVNHQDIVFARVHHR
ncbi:MAG TPA: sialidase family protein [Kofleriaceae bacterium]|nr:sialidase family protein [Kofleriaceae bacterium]